MCVKGVMQQAHAVNGQKMHQGADNGMMFSDRTLKNVNGSKISKGKRRSHEQRMIGIYIGKKFLLANVGIEPKTFALLARRSNQLS